MNKNCHKCVSKFDTTIASFSDDQLFQPLQWSQWTEDEDGFLKARLQTGTVFQGLQSLKSLLPQFLWHVFVKDKQAKAYEMNKEEANTNESTTVLLQMDFAENATCISQDEIQAAHWKQRSVTLYTCVWYYRGINYPLVIVSDSLDHDKRAVAVFTLRTLNEIIQHCPNVSQIKIWTDGPATQFKNRFILAMIPYLKEKYGIYITWNYLAAGHGKGPNDAVGGTAKRMVYRRVISRQATVYDADSFADTLRSTSDNIQVIVVRPEEINDGCQLEGLNDLWAEVPNTIPGVRNTHCVIPLTGSTVLVKFYTLSAGGKEKETKKKNITQTPHRKAMKETQGDVWPCGKCQMPYGDPKDPLIRDGWVMCRACKKWFHETCSETSGTYVSVNFTCSKCG